MTPRKSASLTVFYFRNDSNFYNLVQNAQVNLQRYIDGYDRSVLLKEDLVSVGQDKPTVLLKPNMEIFLNQIVELTNDGYYIDIRIFTHGASDAIMLANGKNLSNEILQGELSAVKTGHDVYPIRSVYGVNCYGHTLNQTWLKLGAKVAAGARDVNFYPDQANKFASEWEKGDITFAQAIRESNSPSSRSLMEGLIAADAMTKFNFDKCPFGKTVLGDHSCSKSYFSVNWGIGHDWQEGKSGAENMEYSSYMFRVGMTDLKRNDMASLSW